MRRRYKGVDVVGGNTFPLRRAQQWNFIYRNWCDRIIANMCARFIDLRFRSDSSMVIIGSRPDRMENKDYRFYYGSFS